MKGTTSESGLTSCLTFDKEMHQEIIETCFKTFLIFTPISTLSSASNNFYAQSSRLPVQLNSFSRIGTAIWNQIPLTLRNLSKHETVSRRFLIRQQSQFQKGLYFLTLQKSHIISTKPNDKLTNKYLYCKTEKRNSSFRLVLKLESVSVFLWITIIQQKIVHNITESTKQAIKLIETFLHLLNDNCEYTLFNGRYSKNATNSNVSAFVCYSRAEAKNAPFPFVHKSMFTRYMMLFTIQGLTTPAKKES